MAKTLEPPTGGAPEPTPDLLAAVVLDTLVSAVAGGSSDIDPGVDAGLTLAEVARACERDPACSEEAREVQAALEILLADELATHDGGRYRPTRAAIRAAELSF